MPQNTRVGAKAPVPKPKASQQRIIRTRSQRLTQEPTSQSIVPATQPGHVAITVSQRPMDPTKCRALVWGKGYLPQCSNSMLPNCEFCGHHNKGPASLPHGRYDNPVDPIVAAKSLKELHRERRTVDARWYSRVLMLECAMEMQLDSIDAMSGAQFDDALERAHAKLRRYPFFCDRSTNWNQTEAQLFPLTARVSWQSMWGSSRFQLLLVSRFRTRTYSFGCDCKTYDVL